MEGWRHIIILRVMAGQGVMLYALIPQYDVVHDNKGMFVLFANFKVSQCMMYVRTYSRER